MVVTVHVAYSFLVLMTIGTGFMYMQATKNISSPRSFCFCTHALILN